MVEHASREDQEAVDQYKKSLQAVLNDFPNYHRGDATPMSVMLSLRTPVGDIAVGTAYGQASASARSLLCLEDIDAEIGAYDARLMFMYRQIDKLGQKKERILAAIKHRERTRLAIETTAKLLEEKEADLHSFSAKSTRHLVGQPRWQPTQLAYTPKGPAGEYIKARIGASETQNEEQLGSSPPASSAKTEMFPQKHFNSSVLLLPGK